ncbi:hypothetical protein [Deinococcus altitudinis]|uniref:hypothetical protein n=1 Tax=Deinococcus altitudinis TaxID=468914 RepID=UPI003892B23E
MNGGKAPDLSAEFVQQFTALAGLPLSLERAADLAPALLPIFEGDVRIAALGLGTLSPLGMPWPLEPLKETGE